MEITLEYWNTLANQYILISSLLGGFSITVVANLITSDNNNKITNRILKIATISACCFLISLFANTQMAMYTTPGGILKDVDESDFSQARTLGGLMFFIGLCSLLALLSLAGWVKSKRTGIFTTVIGITTLLLAIYTMVYKVYE